MAPKKSSKSPAKSKTKPALYKSKPKRQKSSLRGIPKMKLDTIVELACIYLCEENDFSDIRGFAAAELIFVVLALMFIHLTEMDEEYKREKKKR